MPADCFVNRILARKIFTRREHPKKNFTVVNFARMIVMASGEFVNAEDWCNFFWFGKIAIALEECARLPLARGILYTQSLLTAKFLG
jgi:hypothetical protein